MKIQSRNPQASQPPSYEHDSAVDSDYSAPKGLGFKASIKRLRAWGADQVPTQPTSIEQNGLKSTLKRMDILWPGEGQTERPARLRGAREIIGILAVALVGERIANAVAEKLAAEKLQAIEEDFAEKHMTLTTLDTIMTDQSSGLPRRPNLDELVQQAMQEHTTALDEMPTIQLPVIQPDPPPPTPYQPRHLNTEPTPGRHRKDQPGAHRTPEDSDKAADLSHH